MKRRNALVLSALASVLAVGAVTAQPAFAAKPAMEKCYGIAKAHHNDCATAKSSCAGTAAQNNLPYTFVVVPKGTCSKIAGGSLMPKG